MPNTFVLIATTTVGSGGAASIDFTSIPATYTDLKVLICARCTTATATLGLRATVNGSVLTYADIYLQGSGSTGVASGSDTGGTFWYLGELPGSTATASTFGNVELNIPNYRSANHKAMNCDGVQENNLAGTTYGTFVAGLWSTTDAINRITLAPASNNFAEFSSASLYGIKSS
jgi:hypothetical protein